jgi:hypothetical protein
MHRPIAAASTALAIDREARGIEAEMKTCEERLARLIDTGGTPHDKHPFTRVCAATAEGDHPPQVEELL